MIQSPETQQILNLETPQLTVDQLRLENIFRIDRDEFSKELKSVRSLVACAYLEILERRPAILADFPSDEFEISLVDIDPKQKTSVNNILKHTDSNFISKTESSIVSKISRKPGVNPNDLFRFTSTKIEKYASVEDLAGIIKTTQSHIPSHFRLVRKEVRLLESGYSDVILQYESDKYITDNGSLVTLEIQFHTKSSQATKQEEHPIFEKRRRIAAALWRFLGQKESLLHPSEVSKYIQIWSKQLYGNTKIFAKFNKEEQEKYDYFCELMEVTNASRKNAILYYAKLFRESTEMFQKTEPVVNSVTTKKQLELILQES